MGWVEMGAMFFLSFLSFGPSREEGWIDFLSLSLVMDGGNNVRAW